MTLLLTQDFLIKPKEFQSIVMDLKNRNSATVLNLAQKKAPQIKIFKRKKKLANRKSWIESISNEKESFTSAYLE